MNAGRALSEARLRDFLHGYAGFHRIGAAPTTRCNHVGASYGDQDLQIHPGTGHRSTITADVRHLDGDVVGLWTNAPLLTCEPCAVR